MPVTGATVAVRGKLYGQLEDERREDQTFGEAIDRLLDDERGAGDDGRPLRRLPARRLFAFAWQDDHGPDAFLQATDR